MNVATADADPDAAPSFPASFAVAVVYAHTAVVVSPAVLCPVTAASGPELHQLEKSGSETCGILSGCLPACHLAGKDVRLVINESSTRSHQRSHASLTAAQIRNHDALRQREELEGARGVGAREHDAAGGASTPPRMV